MILIFLYIDQNATWHSFDNSASITLIIFKIFKSKFVSCQHEASYGTLAWDQYINEIAHQLTNLSTWQLISTYHEFIVTVEIFNHLHKSRFPASVKVGSIVEEMFVESY